MNTGYCRALHQRRRLKLGELAGFVFISLDYKHCRGDLLLQFSSNSNDNVPPHLAFLSLEWKNGESRSSLQYLNDPPGLGYSDC